MSILKTIQNRREFFRGLGRNAVLAVLGAGGGLLAKRGLNASEHRCVNKSVCCNCGAYAGCRLPAALSAKQAEEGGS